MSNSGAKRLMNILEVVTFGLQLVRSQLHTKSSAVEIENTECFLSDCLHCKDCYYTLCPLIHPVSKNVEELRFGEKGGCKLLLIP
jgi:hypothetical protein